ncbi:MAG TPA: anhydro-N-acetylmuramic acid kinase [Myxococcota bacterium]|nr:anhydro-N-acetylmuramic acid kinase [Myxococcota bacterium]
MLWIGLMSGTSADAIDAALVRAGGPGEVELLALHSEPLPDSLRARIHDLVSGKVELRELVKLDVELGERFAAAALGAARAGRIPLERVRGIASHGQTVGHYPEPDVRGTLQIGSAAVIHARTGRPVVSDFRSADIAAGGQGAPLTPFFHFHRFADGAERRAVLNIGGFTNVTYLPDRDPAHVVAYDPGPGNALLDRAARWASDGRERFDREGARAARGRVIPELVEDWLGDPYFATPPPKSTGHERFGESFFARARDAVLARGGSADDLFACLVRLSVESVARSAERFFPGPVERWILCGGGARNPVLVGALRARVAPAAVDTTDDHGVPGDAIEAMAFAMMGHCASLGEPSNLPAATGAARPVCLGTVCPPDAFADRAR